MFFFLISVQVKNATNSTQRYDQTVSVTDQTATPVEYYIPKKLVGISQPSGSNETVALPLQPKLRMYDALDRWVKNLGRQTERWRVTATIVAGTGDPNAKLIGNTTVEFINGTANFTNLAVTHSGVGYKLKLNVTYPANLNFVFTSGSFDIKERVLYFSLVQGPANANETVPFGQQPKIEVRDAANGELVNNTGWKGRKWLFIATLVRNGNTGSILNGSTTIEFVGAFAHFTNLSIDSAGKGYQLTLKTQTMPSSSYSALYTSQAFDVRERELFLRISQQPGDCNDTVVCGRQPVLEIRSLYPDALAGNLGWKGASWFVNATIYAGGQNSALNGTKFFRIPKSGLIRFTDLNFYDVAVGYKILFKIIVTPSNPKFDNMSLVSDSFDVKQRLFYLALKQQPANVNDSIVFGQQPLVEVRDLGTHVAAKPLKRSWNVTVTISNNPNSGTLGGIKAFAVVGEVATFTDLSITGYGVGYTLLFQSNFGHQVHLHYSIKKQTINSQYISSEMQSWKNPTCLQTWFGGRLLP